MFAAARNLRLSPCRVGHPQHRGGELIKTDAQLQKDVVDELTWDPAVLAINIGIEVKNGIVTLAGEVDTCTEKWNAERDLATRSAWGSAGVSKVLDHMNLVY